MPTTREVARVARTRDAEWFIDELQGVSPGNLRALWLPSPSDTTTNTRKPDGRTWTNSATIAARISYQGNGTLVTFTAASAHVASTPDTANLSFGNGTTDSAFSVAALANVTDSAAYRTIVAKISAAATTVEYILDVTDADALRMVLWDQSAAALPLRTSDSAITQGSVALFGVTYTAATGGATAANDITLYQNGAVIASTATNAGTYVAMEDTAALLYVGGQGTTQSFFGGTIGFAAVYAGALSAAQHATIARICRDYYEVVL